LALAVGLVILIGLTACRENTLPTTAVVVTEQATPVVVTVIATEQATPTATAIATEQEPTATPAEIEPAPTATPTTRPGYFSRDELIEDARQLAQLLESAHPDPYIRGGGRIAFHRRLQRLLNAIPEGGMTRDEFVRLLRPFIAAVGDAHTDIWDDYRVSDNTPGGVPLRFDIVGQSLYVSGAPDKEDSDLIGALLVSVEGVGLAELCERQRQVQGTENEYHVLQLLAHQSLWYKPFLEELLPEWEDDSRVSVELQLPGGEVQELAFDLPQRMHRLHTSESQVALPSTDDSGFLYDFLDDEREIAYLRVDHMVGYREHHEAQAAAGAESSTEETRARIPSATETFRSLVVDMEQAGTDSSGFTLAKYLYLAGTTLVGASSGQAANSFGNGQLWRLDHTGVHGSISSSYSVEFPDGSELARVLPVHYPLTYERLASYDFDPNAEYLYALELLPELEGQ